MTASLDALRAAGLLGPLDFHFARALGRRAGEARHSVLCAAALVSRQVEAGHVCLDLHRLAASGVTMDAALDPGVLGLPPLPELLEALASSPLVGGAAEATPLVLDAAGRLYLRRHYELERRLAQHVRRRAVREPAFPVDDALLARGLERLFPRSAAPSDAVVARPADGDAPDLQRTAAELAVRRSFAVISGGPGTGKTSTVVKILALLMEQSFARGPERMRMHLVAPTGKAALRLRESIEAAKGSLDCAPAIRDAIESRASTIHQALGVVPGGASRFRHDASSPLLTDLVLVDEASMVDLELMTHLFDAVPEGARVLLLGDKNQLASVEAGAVLGDICGAGARPESTGPVAGCITHLERSYRYAEGSGIARLADATQRGDAGAVRTLLEQSEHPDLAWIPSEGGRRLPTAVTRRAAEGYRALLEATSREERLEHLGAFRVLCAHRRGPFGLEALNESVPARLRDLGLLPALGGHHSGQLLMITRNDHATGLSNGDVGLVDRDDEGALRVFFPVRPGEARPLAPARLPPHEPVFAMSIHKSQGSEFDEVLVVLPDARSPLLSRELLYTAITRARRKVTLVGSAEAIAKAVSTPVDRATGLRDALWD